MDNFFWFIIIIPIATWRLTHILYAPERIADFLHDRVGRKPDAMVADRYTYPDTWQAYLLQCYYCLSVWVGLGMVVAWAICPYIPLALFASAITIFIEDKRRG